MEKSMHITPDMLKEYAELEEALKKKQAQNISFTEMLFNFLCMAVLCAGISQLKPDQLKECLVELKKENKYPNVTKLIEELIAHKEKEAQKQIS